MNDSLSDFNLCSLGVSTARLALTDKNEDK